MTSTSTSTGTSSSQATYTAGQAAQRAGVTRKAIRVYEAKGLLGPAGRTEAGYRLFSDDDIALLRFVRQAKTLGLRLEEINDILRLQRGGQQPCTQVIALLDAHLAELDRTLADLHALRDTLAGARAHAEHSRRRGETATVCRIIETTATTAPDTTAR